GEITEGSSSVELAYKDSYGTLPVASREGYTFNGWKTKNMLDTQNAKVYHNNPYSPLYDWERTDSGFKATLLNSSDNYIWSRHGFQIGNTQDLIGKTITVSFGEYIGKSQKPIIQFIATDLVGEPAANFTGVETFSNGYMGSSGLITVLKNGANYNEGNKLTYTIGEDITQQYIGVLFYLCVEEYVEKGDQFEYKNIQVEIGDTATDYSPYVIYAGNYLDASDKVLTIGDHILVADWTPNTYDVTFDANGGSITEGESTKEVTFDSAYGELPSAEKIGHTFDGWYTESSGGTKVTHETIVKIAEDHTLYAHYTINTFTVTIKVNDTERGKVNGQDSITLTLDWGSPIAGGVSETITIDGTVYTAQASAQNDKYSYAFENWTLTGGGTIPLTVTSDLEFVANFDRTARKYQITYDLVVDGITLDNPSEYTAETPTFTLNNPTHDVYEFVGWREEGVEGIKEVVTIEQGSTGPKHFVAVWNKLVVIQASGNNANNTYSVKVEDANGNEVGTYTKSFNVHVGEKYTFKVNANVTSDANNNAYQILKTILVIGNSSETKFVTYSPEHTSIKDSTIINKSAIDDNTMIKFEYLDAYQLVVENSALIAGLTIDIVDNGQDVIVQRANGNYVIANTTRVEFEVNSTPATNATESAYIGLTFEANGQTSTVGVTGGNGIQFVNFKHNPSYADDANVGTYTYKINNTKVSKITINVVETKVVNIVTSAIPTGKSITIESAHGLNKVIDKYTGAVKLYDGIWTIVATTLTLDEIKLVFPNYTVTSSNGVITVEVK
ncbi:MAG: InlB B-repeat-containing protein, partial [Clostridia bacterium]|nr:InlB B-repeat-containing protein [Clostridia bacterium]